MTILYGASGVGKSSVLMAGVVPMLRTKPRTAVVVFRDWQRPDFLTSLKSECMKSVDADNEKTRENVRGQSLGRTLYSALERNSAAQFSSCSTSSRSTFSITRNRNANNRFDGELASAVNRDDVDAGFLLALREEGLARLDRFRARIPNLMGNLLRLRHLDADAAEDAIRKPLMAYNDRLEEARQWR